MCITDWEWVVPCRTGGLSTPAVSELRVMSPEISACSNHGLRSLACQALWDDVACCRCGRDSPPPLPPRINFRDLFCYRTSAFPRGNPKPVSGFHKNLLCNSHSYNTYYKRVYFFHIKLHIKLHIKHTLHSFMGFAMTW